MQVVLRALALLGCIAKSSSPPSLMELAAELELPQSTVHRLLTVLSAEEYVVRDDASRRYMPGPKLFDLVPSRRSDRLSLAAAPVLQRLNERFSETAYIASLATDRAICMMVIESARPLRLNMRVGDHFPWHASAVARAILAFLPAALAQQLLADQPMDQFTINTPRTIEEVGAHLEAIRARGYDVCDDELDSGVWAAAAPIVVPGGGVHSSIGIGGPGDRFRSAAMRDAAVASVKEAAAEIAASLDRGVALVPA